MSRGRIIKEADPVLYDMPSLEKPWRGKDSLYFEQGEEKTEMDAYEKGYTAGEKAGLEMGEQKASVLLGKIENIIMEIGVIKKGLVKELEPQILNLAIDIARKIVIEELTVKPETIVEIVKEAISRIERTGQITIKLNPALYNLFMKLKPELTEIYPDIVFDVDPSVSTTGPVVIGSVEEIVTDIDVQLKNIIDDVGGSLGAY